MAILGNNIYIATVNDNTPTIIAGTRSNEIQSGAELIEISGPNSGQWRQYITGRKEWSFTTNFLLLENIDVRKLLNIGNTFNIAIISRTPSGISTTIQLTGTAILKTCKITSTIGNIANGSFQFVGNGELEEGSPLPQSLRLRAVSSGNDTTFRRI